MEDRVQRRHLLQSGVGLLSVGLAGCSEDDSDYNALAAICMSCSETPEDCSNDPIPSTEEPVASSETLQSLLDEAVGKMDFTECEPSSVHWRPPSWSDETWDDVASVYESLPHGDIRHEGYVLRVIYDDERLPEGE